MQHVPVYVRVITMFGVRTDYVELAVPHGAQMLNVTLMAPSFTSQACILGPGRTSVVGWGCSKLEWAGQDLHVWLANSESVLCVVLIPYSQRMRKQVQPYPCADFKIENMCGACLLTDAMDFSCLDPVLRASTSNTVSTTSATYLLQSAKRKIDFRGGRSWAAVAADLDLFAPSNW